jgi:hypothetical protein
MKPMFVAGSMLGLCLCAPVASAMTPHVIDRREREVLFSADVGAGQYLWLPRYQGIGMTVTGYTFAFQLDGLGKRAVTLALNGGVGLSTTYKTYAVLGGDLGYAMRIVPDALSVEVGARYLSFIDLRETTLGYGNGIAVGPYAQLHVPAKSLVRGPDIMFATFGGGILVGHFDGTPFYGATFTDAIPFVRVGMGIEIQ